MLPDWLLWLLPVPLGTAAAIAWVSWSARRRGPQDPAQTVQDYARFRAAMGAPLPRHGSGREEPDAR